MIEILRKVYQFYRDGFSNMKLGKRLWLLIIIKLFVMFAIIKYFFFPDLLKENFSTDKERGDYILKQLTQGGR